MTRSAGRDLTGDGTRHAPAQYRHRWIKWQDLSFRCLHERDAGEEQPERQQPDPDCRRPIRESHDRRPDQAGGGQHEHEDREQHEHQPGDDRRLLREQQDSDEPCTPRPQRARVPAWVAPLLSVTGTGHRAVQPRRSRTARTRLLRRVAAVASGGDPMSGRTNVVACADPDMEPPMGQDWGKFGYTVRELPYGAERRRWRPRTVAPCC